MSKSLLLRLLQIAVAFLFSTVIGVNPDVADEMRRIPFLHRKRKILHIYNGIDIEFWRRSGSRSFPRDGKPIRIVMVANFFAEKDHMTAIGSIALLKEKMNCSLLLIGEGERRPDVERKVMEFGLDNVHFLGERANVRELLNSADVFLLSTLTEGISIAVLEAMSMEIPVIASDVPGMRRLISDGISGVLVRPRDAQSISDAIERLSEEPELRRTLVSEARKRVVSHYSIDRMVNAYCDLYAMEVGRQGEMGCVEPRIK